MIGLRDNFSSKIKEKLAKRVAYKCSNPKCRISTIGPKDCSNGTISIGEAAHICAASPGGKRYDYNMSSEKRSSYENGIWLCRNCAAMIDRDENTYTVDMLYQWKQDAESEASKNIKGRETNVEPTILSNNDRYIIEKVIRVIEESNTSYMLKDYDYHNDFQRNLLDPLFLLGEHLQQPSASIRDKQINDQVQKLLKSINEFRQIITFHGGPAEYGNGSYIIDSKKYQKAANDVCTKIWDQYVLLAEMFN